MLDCVIDFLPSPDEVEAIQGILEDEETTDQRSSSDEEPFSALAKAEKGSSSLDDL